MSVQGFGLVYSTIVTMVQDGGDIATANHVLALLGGDGPPLMVMTLEHQPPSLLLTSW